MLTCRGLVKKDINDLFTALPFSDTSLGQWNVLNIMRKQNIDKDNVGNVKSVFNTNWVLIVLIDIFLIETSVAKWFFQYICIEIRKIFENLK